MARGSIEPCNFHDETPISKRQAYVRASLVGADDENRGLNIILVFSQVSSGFHLQWLIVSSIRSVWHVELSKCPRYWQLFSISTRLEIERRVRETSLQARTSLSNDDYSHYLTTVNIAISWHWWYCLWPGPLLIRNCLHPFLSHHDITGYWRNC